MYVDDIPICPAWVQLKVQCEEISFIISYIMNWQHPGSAVNLELQNKCFCSQYSFPRRFLSFMIFWRRTRDACCNRRSLDIDAGPVPVFRGGVEKAVIRESQLPDVPVGRVGICRSIICRDIRGVYHLSEGFRSIRYPEPYSALIEIDIVGEIVPVAVAQLGCPLGHATDTPS